jgi:hypothetical protein
MTKGGDKGEASDQGRAATLGLRDWDGRTADPLGYARDDKGKGGFGGGERLPNRNISILILGPQAHDYSQ